MSPLQIRIMLHYSYSAVDADEKSMFMDELEKAGMLRVLVADPDNDDCPFWGINDLGRAYVQKLCSIPIPTETITYTFEDE